MNQNKTAANKATAPDHRGRALRNIWILVIFWPLLNFVEAIMPSEPQRAISFLQYSIDQCSKRVHYILIEQKRPIEVVSQKKYVQPPFCKFSIVPEDIGPRKNNISELFKKLLGYYIYLSMKCKTNGKSAKIKSNHSPGYGCLLSRG